MTYFIEDIDKILNFSSWSNRKKIDQLLEIDATMYMGLGIDSTKTERDDTKKKSRKIYRAIKTLDNYWGGLMLREQ